MMKVLFWSTSAVLFLLTFSGLSMTVAKNPCGNPGENCVNVPRKCCYGLCDFDRGTCPEYPTRDYGKYDLSPTDLKNLCSVVDPLAPTPNFDKCVYMKWIDCDSGPGNNPDRPCGYYKQTYCGVEKKERGKREIEASDLPASPVFLNFPDSA